ncbi:STAS domain-containing protein [Paenisporosarcina indica]|uniref:STAS domain-containing protein n=1 Tax=Paenisporosarcina indica TaxID=650093 RepID=UPI00094F8FB0|nr:STAS domain-containing protein [Paenisporosarcina indica]
MDNEIVFLGERIIENKFHIAKNVNDRRLAEYTEDLREQVAPYENELINIRAHFISLFGEVLRDQLDEEKSIEIISNWGNETGELIFKSGAPLEEALKDTRYYRSYIWREIKNEIEKNNMSIDIVFKIGSIIDPLMDHAAYAFSLTYITHFKSTMINAKTAVLELSVPVVPLKRGVAILPLIGNIDTERAKLLIEETLKTANRLQLEKLIIDLSGVYIVDTMVAGEIFKVIDALKLLGVESILTGIRPEVAQTIIGIGLDFSGIKMTANVEQALGDFV